MILFEGASNILIENNDFENIGDSAVYCAGPGGSITVSGNYINDAGVAGVSLGSLSSCTVTNNHIHNTAQVFGDGGACVHLDTVTGSEISHNNLSLSKRHGVRMHTSTTNTVEFNEIYDTTTDSQDAGSVYWGYSDYNTINNNRIHDSGSFGQQQHGFYVEDGSDHTTITNNIVYSIGPSVSDTACESINVKGVDNLIQNNIFDFTKSHAALRTYEIKANAPANNETVQYNIMYSTGSATTLYYFQSYADDRIKVSDHNSFYKSASGAYVMYNIPGGDTLTNWETLQSNKYDQHSTTSNPGFVDSVNHNYAFVSGAPSGFNPIDVSQVGTLQTFIYPATGGRWVFRGRKRHHAERQHGNGDREQLCRRPLWDGVLGDQPERLERLRERADHFRTHLRKPGQSLHDRRLGENDQHHGGRNRRQGEGHKHAEHGLPIAVPGNRRRPAEPLEPSAGLTESVASTTAVNDGNWHQIVFVNESAASHKIYIDGVLNVSSTATWLYDDTNTEPTRFGRDHNGTSSDNYFNGTIDDVSILSSALGANDVLDLMHLPHS